MNKLLAVVTLSICIVIASTSHLDARSDAPPASTRSRGSNNHYQLPQQQQQSLHNRKSQSALHSRNNATTSTTTTKLTAKTKLDTGDSTRTIDGGGGGGGGSTSGRPLRLRRLSYDESRQQQQHHRRNNHRTGRNFEGRRSNSGGGGGGGSGGASLSPSYPSWQSRYNTNNVRTYSNNGHGRPGMVASAVGKDDIMRDVEHINENDLNNNDWLPRADPEFVTLPPPTTSTTTMTTTTSTTTEGPYGTGFFSRKNGFDGRVDPKVLESRHICVQQRALLVPVKTVEVYNRPMWKHISHPCPAQTNQSNQMCTRVQLVHEPAYRDIVRHKTTKQMVYDCCPGWSRITKSSNACMKPICSGICRNGGTCIGPEACSCPPGYGGKYCEKDINECNEEKPCDQLCYNTDGSFYCQCREGFVLQSDKQSCKKIDNNDDDAFEARDLENEIDSNEVTARLHKIEKSLANERVTTNELQKSLDATYTVVDSLKNRLITLEKQQQDMNHLQTNLVATETRTRKLENMISVLFKCRNSPGPYCP